MGRNTPPKIKTCPLCGIEFTHQGNAKRCKECRFRCLDCGEKKKYYGKYCGRCKDKRRVYTRPCSYPGCTKKIMDRNKTGVCEEHRDYSKQSQNLRKKLERQRSHPQYPRNEFTRKKIIPAKCVVCGKAFLTSHDTLKQAEKTGSSRVCSSRCQGVWAAKHTPRRDTSIERKIESAIKERGWNYQKQVPLCGATIVDFYLPDHRIVIYCDGTFWHQTPERKASDKRQNAILKKSRYTVYRFGEDEINKSPHSCLDRITIESKPVHRQLHLPIAE
jgi:very-short-patch-repair endonuclease